MGDEYVSTLKAGMESGWNRWKYMNNCICIGTVSYTHLDVYKRQGYKSYNRDSNYNRYNNDGEQRPYRPRTNSYNREGGDRPYRSSYNLSLIHI